MKTKWLPIDSAPKSYDEILVMTDQGLDIVRYIESEEDEQDSMGHDAGYIGMYSMPGRSFGNSKYLMKAQNQPTHWLPIPDFYEQFEEEEE